MLKFIPLSVKAKIPPIAESGIAEKISTPYFNERKVKYNINKINIKLTGTAKDNLDFACCKFSNVPPYFIKYPEGSFKLFSTSACKSATVV